MCSGDIVLFNDVAVLYKRVEDLIILVTGSQDENEIILMTVLTALSEALGILLRCAVTCSCRTPARHPHSGHQILCYSECTC